MCAGCYRNGPRRGRARNPRMQERDLPLQHLRVAHKRGSLRRGSRAAGPGERSVRGAGASGRSPRAARLSRTTCRTRRDGYRCGQPPLHRLEVRPPPRRVAWTSGNFIVGGDIHLGEHSSPMRAAGALTGAAMRDFFAGSYYDRMFAAMVQVEGVAEVAGTRVSYKSYGST